MSWERRELNLKLSVCLTGVTSVMIIPEIESNRMHL